MSNACDCKKNKKDFDNKIFIDPCCDRDQCFEKKLSTDKFCCEFEVPTTNPASRRTIYQTFGPLNVTACLKIENVCEDTFLVFVTTKGNRMPTGIPVQPGSCLTLVVNCLEQIEVQCSGSAGTPTVPADVCKGKLEIKLFYDVH
ncbi:S-Ena type endospore appendage [Thermolongibacillus altinsuensis]|uniref:S-Ena type endospore appendage n=1 Tax=Thermolongibacillus altinsuensis TaxID=575256 RepID=UPI00242A30DA|nr:S-Ena type endospore appendage [Thermolongibacillus altinsuensis]GMB08204.1 hypothetical protein B1no1_09140 [Thermolongibacillus altinsuensis]